ncbi:MAG: hypothetical protein HY673_07685 [Chloroflexi bacterium]|nr:hypothetical protein [Chloroflexota bacterium]
MDPIVKNYLQGLQLGHVLVFGNMATVPIFAGEEAGPDYLTLDDALKHHLSQVTETSEGGSVPELKFTNTGDTPVLLLDGEELVGARQNRVLNASILVREKSETAIPVSCCEQGRWGYISKRFSGSPQVMPYSLRQKKMEDVAASLGSHRGYRSDQGRIWEELGLSGHRFKVNSPTGAMKDLFEAREEQLKECLQAFAIKPGQKGVVTFVAGEVAGLDVLSRGHAYATLHPKLVRSYAVESFERKRVRARATLAKAKAFLAEAALCGEEKYPSVGYGSNFRYKGEGIVGAALVHDGAVIHASFFRTESACAAGLCS